MKGLARSGSPSSAPLRLRGEYSSSRSSSILSILAQQPVTLLTLLAGQTVMAPAARDLVYRRDALSRLLLPAEGLSSVRIIWS